jgi:hypothetical protein
MRSLAIMHLAEGVGPPQHLRPLLAALAERGSLDVVAPAEGPTLALYDELGAVSVLPYAPLTFPRGPRPLAGLAAGMARDVGTLRRHIRRVSPDLVVVATSVLPSALVAARLERVPTVVYVAELLDRHAARTPARRAASTVVRTLTESLASGLACCSDAVARQFLPPRNGTVIGTVYPGIGPQSGAGDGDAFRRAHDIVGAAPCLAVVGNITEGRGQDLVLRALHLLRRELAGVRCLFAGVVLERPLDTAYARHLRHLADELDVADLVRYAGFVDPVADVYAAADIVVNPARFTEAFGRVALEALVAGRPVVATRVGAIPEVLRDGEDALLVEPDPEAIAAAVSRLWRDGELRNRLVESGRARALAEFGEAESVERFLALVDEVLRRTGG